MVRVGLSELSNDLAEVGQEIQEDSAEHRGTNITENTKYIGQAIKQAADGKKVYLTNKWGKSGDSDDVNEPRRVLEGMLQELGVKQLDLCKWLGADDLAFRQSGRTASYRRERG